MSPGRWASGGPGPRGVAGMLRVTAGALFADRVLQSKVCHHLFAMRMRAVTGMSGDRRFSSRSPALPWAHLWMQKNGVRQSTEPSSGTGVQLCAGPSNGSFCSLELGPCVRGWCWLAVSGIADCFKECISQSDRCKRIRRVKCHHKTGMTQLTGRTEDVQLRRAEASTCWCWQDSGGAGQGGEERLRGATMVGGWQQTRAPHPAAPVQAGKQPSGLASFLFTMVSQGRALTAPRDGVRAPLVPSAECPHGDLSVWGPVWPREAQYQGHRWELT